MQLEADSILRRTTLQLKMKKDKIYIETSRIRKALEENI